jgi:uncharacterized membrane protein YfcA
VDVGTAAALLLFAGAVGAYGTIIGAGGGFLLIPGLVLLFDLDGAAAVGTGAITLLVIGISGAYSYDRKGLVDRRAARWFASGSMPVALFCGLVVASRIDRNAFADILGMVLLGLAVFVLFIPTNLGERAGATVGQRRALPVAGVFVGFLSGTFAVGGGLVTLPILARTQRLEPHRAAATTSATAMLGTLGGALGHTMAGNVVWSRAGVLIVGAALGSSLGAQVAGRLPAKAVLALVAIGLVGAGIPLLVAA